MKYTINTATKNIQIESATGEEIKQLSEQYPDYTFEMKVEYYWPQLSTPYYLYPNYTGTLTSDITRSSALVLSTTVQRFNYAATSN